MRMSARCSSMRDPVANVMFSVADGDVVAVRGFITPPRAQSTHTRLIMSVRFLRSYVVSRAVGTAAQKNPVARDTCSAPWPLLRSLSRLKQ